MSQPVLHLDFVSLNDSAGPGERESLVQSAAGLSALPQVESLGVIEADAASGSDFDIVFYFLLSDFTALEPFGTDPRYVAFLQGAIAPRLKAFAGADVRLDGELNAEDGPAACLAVMAPEETYDWEIREALEGWSQEASVGLAVGDRQLYRGAALVFGGISSLGQRPDAEKFRSTLIAGRARVLA